MVAGINLEPVTLLHPYYVRLLLCVVQRQSLNDCVRDVLLWYFKTLRGCGFELSGFFDNYVKKKYFKRVKINNEKRMPQRREQNACHIGSSHFNNV
jgi:hypothetical protein